MPTDKKVYIRTKVNLIFRTNSFPAKLWKTISQELYFLFKNIHVCLLFNIFLKGRDVKDQSKKSCRNYVNSKIVTNWLLFIKVKCFSIQMKTTLASKCWMNHEIGPLSDVFVMNGPRFRRPLFAFCGYFAMENRVIRYWNWIVQSLRWHSTCSTFDIRKSGWKSVTKRKFRVKM